MKLHIINTGSIGNSYVLTDSNGKMLLIDAGVNFKEIQQAIAFKYNDVIGALLTHEHGDHNKSIKKVVEKCINVYTGEQTAINSGIYTSSFCHVVEPLQTFKVGAFAVTPFSVQHDVPCFGFLIDHNESGQIVFATDLSKLNALFPDARHFIIEANYCAYKLADRELNGIGNTYVNERVKRSHLSIQQAVKLIELNKDADLRNIVLIHLSDANSDEGSFHDQITHAFGIPCHIAKKGLTVDLSLHW